MATLTVTQSEDYRDGTPPIPFNVTDIVFNTSGFAAAIFGSNQFGLGSISNSVRLTGDGFTNVVTVKLSATGSFSAAAWTFTNWSPTDRVSIEGTAGADTITGSDQADNITGGGGADILQGGAGADLFAFTAAGDAVAGESIDGGSGDDRLAVGGGTSHNLSIVALTSLESLSFSDDSNTTVIFAGSQIGVGAVASIIGNAGANALVVNGQTVDLSGVSFSSWTAGTDTVTINGNNLNLNTLVGSSERDTITGGGLADTITGGGGLDTLSGGGGNDTFRYLAGSDAVAGESVDGGAGTDTLQIVNGGTYDFTGVILSNLERLNLSGGDSAATFSSTQIGAGAISQIVGAAGVQNLIVNAVSDVDLTALTFTDWTGVDSVRINGSAAGETITGSSQADFIVGGDGADTMNGGGGDDRFLIGAGDFDSGESIDGGAGTDTLLFSAAGSFVNFTAGTLTGIEALNFEADGEARFNASSFGPGQISSVRGGDGDNLVTIEGASSLDLSGLALVNWNEPGDRFIIFGTAAADVITGTEGRDSNIQGNGGADTLNGGDGDDTFRFLFSDDVVAGEIIDGGTGTDLLFMLADSDFSVAVLSNLEGAIIGDPLFGPATATFLSTQIGAGKITSIRAENSASRIVVNAVSNVDLSALTFSQWSATNAVIINGTASSETLIGSSQNDTIEGDGGADLLDGGTGADTMAGGAGNDVYYVDNAGDLIIELPGGGTDRVHSTVNHTLANDVEDLTLEGPALVGTGNARPNLIKGNAGANTLSGLGNSDDLYGYAGDDTLLGGGGFDDLYGGNGADTLQGEEGNDRLYGQGGNDFVNGGAGDDNVFGGGDNDNLQGGNGADILNGQAGNDLIVGGPGNDLLVGGPGADRFLFNPGHLGAGLSATDRIKDFSHAQGDTIDLHNLDADTTTAGNQAFSWIGGAAFSGAAGQLRFAFAGNTTTVYGDTDGDGTADFALWLTGQIALVAGDFVL
jgi:Ca2+-binding RTX toxin-like protein